MSRSEDDDALTRWADFSGKHFSTITDVGLAALKVHIAIEGVLRYLLAARLGVTENSLPRITFDLLSKLALAGVGDSHLVSGIKALNDARNALAHLQSPDLQDKLAIFVREIGYSSEKTQNREKTKIDWPMDSFGQLRSLKDALEEAGCAILRLSP